MCPHFTIFLPVHSDEVPRREGDIACDVLLVLPARDAHVGADVNSSAGALPGEPRKNMSPSLNKGKIFIPPCSIVPVRCGPFSRSVDVRQSVVEHFTSEVRTEHQNGRVLEVSAGTDVHGLTTGVSTELLLKFIVKQCC